MMTRTGLFVALTVLVAAPAFAQDATQETTGAATEEKKGLIGGAIGAAGSVAAGAVGTAGKVATGAVEGAAKTTGAVVKGTGKAVECVASVVTGGCSDEADAAKK